MLAFSNAKINLGLNVIEKRPDGYHNIESVLYPIPFYDVVEVIPANKFSIRTYGVLLSNEDNLCTKAFLKLQNQFNIPAVKIILLKKIPLKSGLGGGSSNASFALKLINSLFDLNLSSETLKEISLQIGSDCPFFIENKPSHILGRGDIISPIDLTLEGMHLTLVFPKFTISTQNAFSNVEVDERSYSVKQIIETEPIHEWHNFLINDFECYLIKKHPEIETIKIKLYEQGALYVSLTGTGSCIYAISESKLKLSSVFSMNKYWQAVL